MCDSVRRVDNAVKRDGAQDKPEKIKIPLKTVICLFCEH